MKRREFVKKTVLGGAAVVLGGASAISAPDDTFSAVDNLIMQKPLTVKESWSFPLADPIYFKVEWSDVSSIKWMHNKDIGYHWCTVDEAVQRELFDTKIELTKLLNIGRE